MVADTPALAEYDPEVWAAAVAQIAREGEAHTVLIGGSRSGREYSPRVAVKLDAPLIEDAISLIDDAGALTAEHYTFLARVTEDRRGTGSGSRRNDQARSVLRRRTPMRQPAEQYDAELDLPQRRVTLTGRTTEKSERVSLTRR